MLGMAMDAITAIRNVRAEANAAPSKRLNAVILARGEDLEKIRSAERYIRELANIKELKFTDETGEVISPFSTLKSCGSSSRLSTQIFLP